MHDRVDARMEKLQAAANRLHRQIDKGILGGEEARIWLDKYAVGVGYNIACGDFVLGESIGVDGDAAKIAPDVLLDWQNVPLEADKLDHIVTNYFECFSDPMRILEDWYVRLKLGGWLAIVCRDADAYLPGLAGPLANRHRRSCFTLKTLTYYLQATGFVIEEFERWEKELRVAARKV